MPPVITADNIVANIPFHRVRLRGMRTGCFFWIGAMTGTVRALLGSILGSAGAFSVVEVEMPAILELVTLGFRQMKAAEKVGGNETILLAHD